MATGTLSIIGLVISVLALGLSGTTAWLTLLRRGRVRMTQPTLIYFGHKVQKTEPSPIMKVYLRDITL